jgi:hypothetical protein
MTAMTGWAIACRGVSSCVGIVLLVIVCFEARRVWIVARQWFLAVSFAFIIAGFILTQVENTMSYFVLTSDARWTVQFDTMLWNVCHGVGNGCFTIGVLVLPMMWIDVGLAGTRRLQKMHAGLLVSRRVLLSYILFFGAAMVVALLATPYYPHVLQERHKPCSCVPLSRKALDWVRRQEAFVAYGFFTIFNVIVIMLVYVAGACLFKRVLVAHVLLDSRSVDPTDDATSPTRRFSSVESLHGSVEQLARRIAFLMTLSLLGAAVNVIGTANRSIPLYYLGALSSGICSNSGTILSMVLYSRQAHRDALKRRQNEGTFKARPSDLPGEYSPRASEGCSSPIAALAV